MKEKVLVTGSGGFVGKHTCKYLLKKGFEIVGTNGVRAPFSARIDITNLSQLLSLEEKIGAIIHLAGKASIENSFQVPYETYRVNVFGTLNLLEFARQKKVPKIINLSTYVYGEPKYLPIDEKHPIIPHSPYNKSKVVAEQLCQYYSQDFDIDIVTLRPFYLYGACSRPNSFIYHVMNQLMKENGNVKLSGKGTRRDFLFIDDFLDLMGSILKKFPRGYNTYNVGFGKSHTLSEVALILARLLNKKIYLNYDDNMRPKDITNVVADISKISIEFNWKPSTKLEAGLKDTLQYYLSSSSS